MVLVEKDARELIIQAKNGYVLSYEERLGIEKCAIFMEACTGDNALQKIYDALELHPLEKRGLEKFVADEYTDYINNFPPHVQRIAGIFFRTFDIPTGMIPRRRERSRLAEWIIQFEFLDRVGEQHSPDAMVRTFKKCEQTTFPVARPAAINKYFSASVSEILREIKTQNKPEKKDEGLTGKKSVADIGSMFNDNLEG